MDLKENLTAFCIRQSVVDRYNLTLYSGLRAAKITTTKPTDLKTVVGHGETLQDILVQELVRVYIAVGRSRNIKDKPRPEDYWVALDYNERGIFYGHLIPRTDSYQEGKYSVPVGTETGSKATLPAQEIHNGDRGGDPRGTFNMDARQQQAYMRSLVSDVQSGNKVFGQGKGIPSDTATIITSNDPASTTGIRVETGAVHADEAGKSSEYDPADVDNPDRFHAECEGGT